MLKLVYPKPFRYTPYRPEVVVIETEPVTPAERLLAELIEKDRHLREYVERLAKRDGLTLRQRVKGAINGR